MTRRAHRLQVRRFVGPERRWHEVRQVHPFPLAIATGPSAPDASPAITIEHSSTSGATLPGALLAVRPIHTHRVAPNRPGRRCDWPRANGDSC
jgi:hypothetical protein